MLCEENVKRKKLQEKYVILEKESKNLRGEVESLTEVIRLLQAEKTNTEDHKDPPSEDIIKEWQTPNKTASQKQPLRFTPLVETRNRFNVLSDENKDDNLVDKKNDTFAIQMENIKLKRKINYLEKIIGSPSEIETFDKDFFNKVSDSVRESLFSFLTDRSGVLSEPLEYKEIAHVCSTLKLGVSGVEIEYEHIRFAGPPFWKLLFQLYQTFFNDFSVCDSLLTGVILPLFKGKGAKANNKDNYRGITLFPALCKIYEMVLLSRLEKFAEQQRLFSNMQFGFKEVQRRGWLY